MRCGAVGRLPGLPVARVLLAPLAVLAQGDAIRVVALGLVRHVVATLADLAREGHSDTHVSAGHSALRDCKRTEKRPAVGRSAVQSSASRPGGIWALIPNGRPPDHVGTIGGRVGEGGRLDARGLVTVWQ